MASPEVHSTLRMRDVVLDVAAYELRRDGRAIRLERQPMDLLILLVEHRGHLVSRSQIIDAMWGKDVFVDVETGVHTAIRKIRQALRDPADAPVFIETVPGKGYRFIAPVEVLSPERTRPANPPPEAAVTPVADARAALQPASVERPRGPGGPASPTPIPIAAAPAGWARRVSVVAAVLLAVAALAGIAGWSWRRSARPDPGRRLIIAVLPFLNLSRDPGDEYLAAGLAEDTIVSLGRMDPDHVSVIGRTSMLAYRGTTKSLAEIGRDLAADYVVESSLRAEGESVRITARLVRAIDQVQIWSESFDKTRGNVLDVQQELSQRIAENVRARLSPPRAGARARQQTGNAEAYDQFLRGRDFLNQRNPDAMRRAIAAFERATTLDPDYALAWAGLSITHAARVVNSDADPRVVLPIARAAAVRAVRVDPGLSEAQHALGTVHWLLEWNWAAAEGAFRRSAELDPNSSFSHQSLGHMLSQAARHAEAEPAMRRARELDPRNATPYALSSQVAFQGRDPRAALEFARRAIELNRSLWFGYQMLGQALEQLGQNDTALEALSSAVRLSGRNSKPVSLEGYVLARAGRTTEAHAVLASLEAASRERYVPPYAMALVHAGLGDKAAVFDWLERAYAVRDVHLMYLPVDPKWDPYRADPRFVALLERCRLTAS
jgi:TolB-like protein/DNA-binding winged helix-turn-helix (wHTH) protein/Flp pilus assembly protein TadD